MTDANYLAVAEELGYVERAEGRDGYRVATLDVILAEIRSLRSDALSWRDHMAKISCPACCQPNPIEGEWFEDHEYPCWACGVMLTPVLDPEDGSWAFPRAEGYTDDDEPDQAADLGGL